MGQFSAPPPAAGRLRLLGVLGLCLAACSDAPTAPPVPAPPADLEWTEVPGNPILEQPTCPTWNCLGMSDPWLGRMPDGRTVLWVSAGGDAGDGGPVVGRATGPSARQLTFDASAPQLTPRDGVWDRWRETVSMRYDPGTERWTMWTLSYSQSFFDDPAIGQYTSSDAEGTVFERPPAPIYRPTPGAWDGAFITDPVALRTPDGGWRLYYVGAGTTVGVGLLTSSDGQTWTPHPDNPVFERDLSGWDQGFVGIDVALIDGRYHLWYSGYEEPLDLTSTPISIGLATSEDGIRWERAEANPVIRPGPEGAWNELRIVSPSVRVEPDGTLLMAVHGQNREDANGRSLGRIGLYRYGPAGE
ncbi:MAG: hypothetical protein AAGK21_00295 [Bacteroidota bacterium]